MTLFWGNDILIKICRVVLHGVLSDNDIRLIEEEISMINTILFDLDGTLLPMDQEIFTKEYFKRLAAKLLPYGYEPQQLIDGIWAGTAAMVKNDGSCTNETAFWRCFSNIFGEKALKDKPVFDEYYRVEFQQVSGVCGRNPLARELLDWLKSKGMRLVLATNPIFPAVATESRIRWAGFEPEAFEWYTTYENIGFCKPNPAYYREILKKLGLTAAECLMVGNDAEEDLAAQAAGIRVFLLTDCLINRKGRDISHTPQGGFDALWQYIKHEIRE